MLSIESVEYLHARLREELEARDISAAEAARRAEEKNANRMREVLNGRQRLSAELLGKLVLTCDIDSHYVLTGERNAHAITIDHVKAAFAMVSDAEAQLPEGQYLTSEQRVGAICSLLKTAQAVGQIPDASAAVAVLMALN